jgi:hypothetical protein
MSRQSKVTSQLGFQQVVYKTEQPVERQEISKVNVPNMVDPGVGYMNHMAAVQNLQLQSHLQYAQLRYQALMSSYLSGGNI